MADAKQCALQRTWPQRTALSSVCECAVLRFTERITADEDGLRKQTHTHTHKLCKVAVVVPLMVMHVAVEH